MIPNWIAATLGLLSQQLLVNSRKSGIVYSLIGNIIWILITVFGSHDWAFVTLNAFYVVINTQGIIKWRRSIIFKRRLV